MVFQRKSGGKAKQQTPAKSKKSFSEDLDDMDMDFNSDSKNNQVMTKTPGKTPKGKKAQNDKRVSFQIPGKNTPNKGTPKGALVGKKQATPAKVGSLKAFGGMAANSSAKKNGKAKKVSSDDDDDDEDEDDDDDDDEEEEDDDEGADLDMLLEGDDSEDDDDDDDDEDDDEDDDKGAFLKASTNKTNIKQLNQAKSPKLSVAKNTAEDDDEEDDDSDSEEEELPQSKQQVQSKNAQKKDIKQMEKTPIKKEAVSPKKAAIIPIVKNFAHLDAQRRRERDLRTLYVGNLPKDISGTELKALSSDILAVNLPNHQRGKRSVFAFLEFVSESKAEENFKVLKNKKLRGEALTIDYTGEKSLHRKPTEQPAKDLNLKKLYIADIPADGMMDQVAKLFPKSTQITLVVRPTFKSATILFSSEEDAAEAIEAAKSAKIGSKPITVVYSIQRDSGGKKKRKRSSKGKQQDQAGAKKMKVETKEESDDDDDDNDDEE